MSAYAWWWIASFVLLIVELMTGTFYVLMISLALAAGGLVALAGGGLCLADGHCFSGGHWRYPVVTP